MLFTHTAIFYLVLCTPDTQGSNTIVGRRCAVVCVVLCTGGLSVHPAAVCTQGWGVDYYIHELRQCVGDPKSTICSWGVM